MPLPDVLRLLESYVDGSRLGRSFDGACEMGRVRSYVRPVGAVLMAAGPDAVRGSDPNQFVALIARL